MMNDGFKWLLPGMRVKRWVALILLGLLLVLMAILLWDPWSLVTVENAMHDWILRHSLDKRWIALFAGVVGVGASIIGVQKMIHSIVEAVSPNEVEHLAERVYRKRSLERGPHIVVIGGGTGLSTLLRGLKAYSSNITAIVTVADDGGSSGRIREELGILPPGDIRNTLVALADTEPLMERLFQYRFSWGEGLVGHSFGNLFIAAMTDITGNFETAIKASSRVLAVGGVVLPSTLSKVRLKATYTDGSEVIGESQIPLAGKKIERISLIPAEVKPLPEALSAIEKADLIVLGPGSLYTSVIPNLLVQDICDALVASRALKVYVCNVMTQPGETDGMSASDHIKALFQHAQNKTIFSYTLLNNQRLTPGQARKYTSHHAYPIKNDLEEIRKLQVIPICAPLLDRSELVRHDSELLARALMKLLADVHAQAKS